MSINNCTISGRLTKDVECRMTQSGKSVAAFTLAVDDGFGDNKKTYFFRVNVWGNTADSCGKYLTKGQKATVQGRLQQRKWEKDGQKHETIEIVASNVEFGEKPKGAGGGGWQDADDEDIPF